MKNELNRFMTTYLDQLNAETSIKKAMKYSLISDGKMIRPLVFFNLLETYNIDYKKFLNIGCAIEMIHTYSLIHDDLPAMDDDDERRGRPSLHKHIGEDIAILAGDALLTHAFDVALDCELVSDKKVQIIREIVSASGVNLGMINGQVLDIQQNNPSIADLEQIHLQKTSKLISLPFVIAAIIAEADTEKCRILGEKIGIVYQIQDDYLDLYGSNIGKKIGSDLANNKITYTTYYDKEQLETIISNINTENIKLATEMNFNSELVSIIKSFGDRKK